MTTLTTATSYLTKRINTWYTKHGTSHGITGRITNIYAYGHDSKPDRLIIEYIENRDGGHPIYDIPNICDIPDYATYTLPQLFDYWLDFSEWSSQLQHSTTHAL